MIVWISSSDPPMDSYVRLQRISLRPAGLGMWTNRQKVAPTGPIADETPGSVLLLVMSCLVCSRKASISKIISALPSVNRFPVAVAQLRRKRPPGEAAHARTGFGHPETKRSFRALSNGVPFLVTFSIRDNRDTLVARTVEYSPLVPDRPCRSPITYF
jgi:hypothetical protein